MNQSIGSVKINAVFPSENMRKRYRIAAGRAIIWEAGQNGRERPVLCHVGQVFEDSRIRYQIVSDQRYPSNIQKALDYFRKGEPIMEGLNIKK